jgi:microcystin degradation protein MlrC
VTVVDEGAVAACFAAGIGECVQIPVGATIDSRYCKPFQLQGTVSRLGDDPVVLTGPSFTGMPVSMGRWAVVWSGETAVLLTERPALTIDPATFHHVGLDPAEADVVVVRSATLYRAAYPAPSAAASVTLDLPGASTPRLDRLEFTRAPRPLHPVDA